MKIKEFQGYLKENKIDLALILNLDSMKYDSSLFYFSKYKGVGVLIIPKNKKPFLMVPKMELERAKRNFKKTFSLDKKKLFESVRTKLKKDKIRFKTLGIDCNSINVVTFKALKKEIKKIKIKDISKGLLDIRKVKTGEETAKLSKACNLADDIFQKCLKNFRKFKTETDVAAFLEHETKKRGCDVSFPPIIASGKNASMPHHEPQNTKLRKGFCVIDFGVKYGGYCSDMTRTVYIGKPNQKEKKIYDFLLGVQKDSIKGIKEGDGCGKIYRDCVKGLKGYSKYFTHGLGHGVGVEIHELPNLSLNSKDKINRNMVFTIEPGIYIPNKLGIRIEDTVLMKKSAVCLTKSPKELIVVG